VVSERFAPCHPQCMSPARSGYRELGIENISLDDNLSCMPKKPSMEEEKRDDRT
jgi:hypothetical protein